MSSNRVAVAFGARMWACRVRASISQEELARRAAVHRSAVSQLERGLGEPRLGTVVKVADALGITLGELLGDARWSAERGFEFGGGGGA